MKKFFYLSLLGAALLVQPVSGFEGHHPQTLASQHASGKPAPQPVKLAASSNKRFVPAEDIVATETATVDTPASERTDWTLLAGALLFIGVVIRRRTAVR